jgi:transcriptional regulator with XRE-family HTH domain
MIALTLRIAAVVREKRKAKGLTQEELAEIIGVSSGYIGQLEREEIMQSMTVVARLIDFLGIDANTIFFEDSEDVPLSKEISLRASRLPKENQEIILGIIGVIEDTYRKGKKYEDSNMR